MEESQARLAAEEAAKQQKLAQDRAAEQKAREEAERQAKVKQERLNREKAAAAEQVRKEVEHQSKVNSDPSAKKFPWLPALFISAAVFGSGGLFWQFIGQSPVGASPAGDSSPPQQTNPVQKESLAGQAPTAVPTPPAIDPVQAQANEVAQLKATLAADDKTAWPAAVGRLIELANKEDSEAMYLLGIVYQNGRGADKDIKASCKFYVTTQFIRKLPEGTQTDFAPELYRFPTRNG